MAETPRVWLIRAQYGRWTDAFANNGYMGIHYGLDGANLTNVRSVEGIRRYYEQENPGEDNPRSVAMRAGQVARFVLDTRASDFVLTPGLDSDEIRVGRITTGAMYYTDGSDGLPCRNRKKVNWSPRRLSRRQLPTGMMNAQHTVSEIRDAWHKRALFAMIGEEELARLVADGANDGIEIDLNLRMPEDSWVPFHLEVGRKLIEGEWWGEDRRGQLMDLIQRLREADPAGMSEINETSDPFNLYQSFCQGGLGLDRMGCFEVLRGALGLDVELPDGSNRIWATDSGWRIEEVLEGRRLEALWDLFRAAMEMDPANDLTCRGEFASKYNLAHAARGRHRWPRIMSR